MTLNSRKPHIWIAAAIVSVLVVPPLIAAAVLALPGMTLHTWKPHLWIAVAIVSVLVVPPLTAVAVLALSAMTVLQTRLPLAVPTRNQPHHHDDKDFRAPAPRKGAKPFMYNSVRIHGLDQTMETNGQDLWRKSVCSAFHVSRSTF
jgi:hypothetical protein